MPSVRLSRSPSELQEADSDTSTDPVQIEAEKIQLFLPSACPSSVLHSTSMESFVSKEAQLRIAQAHDALAYIKKLRRILVTVATFKHQNVSGTGGRANTRIRTLYDKFQGRIRLAATRYRAAYSALLILDPDGSWNTQLRVLLDDDIRGPGQDTDGEVLGEGRREHSWIWLVGSNADSQTDESETQDAMRVEWGKTQARAQRWTEEVQLLQEEMRRVLEFLTWRASWWRSRPSHRETVDTALASGLIAYSEKQAVVLERLAQSFAKQWSPILKKKGFQFKWQRHYDKAPRPSSLWEVERVEKELDQEENYRSSDEDDPAEEKDSSSEEEKDTSEEEKDSEEERDGDGDVHMQNT